MDDVRPPAQNSTPVPTEPNAISDPVAPAPRAAVPPAPTVPLSQPTIAPSPSLDASATNTQDQQLPDDKPLPSETKPKGNIHFGPIIVGVIVALALIGAAGYAYWQNKDKSSTNNDTTTQQVKQSTEATKSTTVQQTPATANDVTDVDNQIQKEIKKVDDTKDANEKDLSDTTLGIN